MNSRQENESYLVSVFCVVRNQIFYIRQCLDSLIEQKTTFLFEIILCDDASDDGSAEVVKEYESKYPDIIKAIYRKSEAASDKWTRGIKEQMLALASGRYLAFCDAVDYWDDPQKMQKQVDFLESNADYTLVCANFKNYVQNSLSFLDSNNREIGEGDDAYGMLIRDEFFCFLSSVCCARKVVDLLPLPELEGQDGWFVMTLMASLCGKIKYMPESVAVRRILPETFAHSNNRHSRRISLQERTKTKLRFLEKHPIPDKKENKTTKSLCYYMLTKYALKSGVYFNMKFVRLISPFDLSFLSSLIVLLSKNSLFFCLLSKIVRIYEQYKIKKAHGISDKKIKLRESRVR